MVLGTSSGAGKSLMTAALCRVLKRRGETPLPFKGQNMSNNAWVDQDGGEMAYSQALQAWAAGLEPMHAMNPVLLKPQGDSTSEVIHLGNSAGTCRAEHYYRDWFDSGWAAIRRGLEDLQASHPGGRLVLEGAGSPVEVNLQAKLSDEAYRWIQGSTDSEHLFALAIDEYQRHEPGTLAALEASLLAAIRQAEELREAAGIESPSWFNLVICDGERAVATRAIFGNREGVKPESLYYHVGRRYVCEEGVCRMVPVEDAGAVLVASEPLSADPGWQEVPAGHLIAIAADRSLEVRPLAL